MAGTYKVYIDFDNDGSFAGAREDVTSRVLDGRTPVTMQYGRDSERSLSPIAVGESRFALDNASRDYSPENASSPLAGQVLPARNVLITGQAPGGSVISLFRGQLEDFKVQPAYDERYIQAECVDPLGELKGIQVTTDLWRGLRPGEAIGVILDAAGVPTTLRDLDVGTTVMPFWWLNNANAYDAVMSLVASEGPPALFTVDGQGRYVFRGRHHRLLNTASTTVQSTWRSSGIEPCISSPTEYNHGWKEIVNTISFDVPIRSISNTQTAVWSSQGQIGIAAGETVLINASGADPFTGAVTPEAGTDYTLLSGSVTMTISRTSGASTTIAITATGGAALISDLQLRAYSVTTVTTIQVTASDSTSVGKYGPRSLPDSFNPTWASTGDARSIAGIILGQRGERLPTISVGMVSTNNTRLNQQLGRNLSDRVHVIEEHTGLDSDCFINQIAHTITQGGTEHRTVFGCEKAQTQLPGAFVLGSATSGVLGTNVLGRRGFTDPSRMFILGSATNGVLGSSILAP